jgi:transcriptional regulator with PAS, ATPase and Fis domain
LGRSGTGKELFAESIHNASLRAKHAFVAVNCAAVPENLLESELFGYVDGAFTGAVKGGKAGYFEMAHGGALFLDEIGEMSMSLQAKLLRVIQEREIVRLGDSQVRLVNIRLICATNRNLTELVKRETFREDLFYRLNVLSLTIPALNERMEDIPIIANQYFEKKYPNLAIEPGATELLQQYSWPGNVRQLINCCERLAVLCEDGIIARHNIQQELELLFDPLQAQTFSEFELPNEKEQIINILEKTHFNRTKAALMLGFDRSTLWRKMKYYQI